MSKAKSNMLKDAIADASALKEAAVQVAKLAIQDSLTPKIKSMLAAQLAEDLGDEDEEEQEDEAKKKAEEEDEAKKVKAEDETEEEETDEAKKAEEEDDEEEQEDESFDVDAILKEMEDEGDEEEEDEAKKKAEEEDEAVKKDGEEEDDEEEADETFDLKSLFEEDEEEEEEEGKKLTEDDKGILMTALAPVLKKFGVSDDVIKKLTDKAREVSAALSNAGVGMTEAKKKAEEEEDEAVQEKSKEIKELKESLKTINFLNSKLMYLSKTILKHSLTESQKSSVRKIVETFDKTKNASEAKLVFDTLNETFNSVKAQSKKKAGNLKESFGIGSNIKSGKKKEQINESTDPLIARWQKLANIQK